MYKDADPNNTILEVMAMLYIDIQWQQLYSVWFGVPLDSLKNCTETQDFYIGEIVK